PVELRSRPVRPPGRGAGLPAPAGRARHGCLPAALRRLAAATRRALHGAASGAVAAPGAGLAGRRHPPPARVAPAMERAGGAGRGAGRAARTPGAAGTGCGTGTAAPPGGPERPLDRKSTRLNSSHVKISYAVFCLKKKKTKNERPNPLIGIATITRTHCQVCTSCTAQTVPILAAASNVTRAEKDTHIHASRKPVTI